MHSSLWVCFSFIACDSKTWPSNNIPQASFLLQGLQLKHWLGQRWRTSLWVLCLWSCLLWGWDRLPDGGSQGQYHPRGSHLFHLHGELLVQQHVDLAQLGFQDYQKKTDALLLPWWHGCSHRKQQAAFFFLYFPSFWKWNPEWSYFKINEQTTEHVAWRGFHTDHWYKQKSDFQWEIMSLDDVTDTHHLLTSAKGLSRAALG